MWIVDAENRMLKDEAVNPLNLDEEFNFIEWNLERSIKDNRDDSVYDDENFDIGSMHSRQILQEHQLGSQLKLYDFLALEK